MPDFELRWQSSFSWIFVHFFGEIRATAQIKNAAGQANTRPAASHKESHHELSPTTYFFSFGQFSFAFAIQPGTSCSHLCCTRLS